MFFVTSRLQNMSCDTINKFHALDMLKCKLFFAKTGTVVLFLDKMGFWKHWRSLLGVLEWPQPPILAVPLHFFVQNYHPDRWFRTRSLTLELIVGHWSGAMNFRNLDLSIEKVNPIRQKKWWSEIPSPVHNLKFQNYLSRVALILIFNPSCFKLCSSISSCPCLLHRQKTLLQLFSTLKNLQNLEVEDLASSSWSLFCFVFVHNLYPEETFYTEQFKALLFSSNML